MKPRLLWAIATGEMYAKVARLTHPLMEAYASRIGADFIAMREVDKKYPHPSWGKMGTYDFLEQYERVIYMDSDIVIRPDAPDLFALVPPDKLGALVENFVDAGRPQTVRDYFQANGWSLRGFDDAYFNAGLLITSQRHRALFEDPGKYPDSMYEQTLLNGRRWNHGFPVHDLSQRVCAFVGRGQEDSAPFVHFAARFGDGLPELIRTKILSMKGGPNDQA